MCSDQPLQTDSPACHSIFNPLDSSDYTFFNLPPEDFPTLGPTELRFVWQNVLPGCLFILSSEVADIHCFLRSSTAEASTLALFEY